MSSERINWYRTPLDAQTLREFTQRSDLRALLYAGSFLLIFAVTTGTAVYFFLRQNWIAMAIACYVHSTFYGFMSMAAAVHELSHGTAFKTKALNEFFYKLFSFLTWNNPVHFRASHALHHQYTVHRGVDKEVVQGPVMERISLKNLIFWFTLDIPHFLRFVGLNFQHAAGDGEADYFFWDPLFPPDDPRRREMIRWARIVVVGHLLLLGLFIVTEMWVLIYLITFGSFFATGLSKLCGALQHTGLSESTPDWRLVCYTVKFGPVMRFLYWNMNYHIEHHMYAAVPFYRLPRFHEHVKHDFPEPQPGFLRALRHLWSIKRIQQQDPAYVYRPELPDGAAPPRWAPNSAGREDTTPTGSG